MRKWHLVTYDVRDNQRLRKVANILEGYGERIQYSVFRCHLSPIEVERLRWELSNVSASEDSVLFLPLCSHCASGASGIHQKKAWDTEPASFVVL